ncbi:MAG: UDP-N-acetylmuramate--L-alanine ligase [Candidatus Sericytochromatia bacterium]|nr:UDP-N-acetylmuramate--L-alanine ligase [Candidatus Tanganyikabacteria bacterium]
MRIPSQLHFVGIGGVGMSAVAQVWHEGGGKVSGSDIQPSPTVRRLEERGIRVHIGHSRDNVADLLGDGPGEVGVVVSTAVAADNPELVAAREQGVAIYHRSEILAALMGSKRSIAVTGTHGKTTTTGMIGTVLLEGGLDPTILVGGDLPAIGGTARTGRGEHLVAEADESDRSILRLTADTVVVTNLEGDHLDHYRDLEDIIDTVATFINRLPAHAVVLACIDDPGVRSLLPRLARKVVTYGWSEGADYRLSGEQLSATGSTFHLNGTSFELRVPGRHNVSNAAAAIAIATLAGMDEKAIWAGLARFAGVGRRFQLRGVAAGVQVLEDYAHHPSEIKATLQTAKLLKRPVWVVFQPHRFSRTAALLEDFAHAFGDATGVAIMDIYSAGEAPNGVSARDLVDRVCSGHPDLKAFYWPDHQTAEEGADLHLKSGDVVILMGAGNVNRLAEPLLERLRLREAAVARPPA